MKHILSLGAGVQSSTMALMAAHGEITPMPDCAVFSDTQAEPRVVYDWLDWLEKQLQFPVHRVTAGNLEIDTLNSKSRRRIANPPFYTAPLIQTHKANSTGDRTNLPPPFYTINRGKEGQLKRQCTREYKIEPLNKFARQYVGLLKGMRAPKGEILVTRWIGISMDEAHRSKLSKEAWATNRHPLLELHMTRQHCLDWMAAKGYPRPGKSACYFCPYHDDSMWRDMKINQPDEWERAVEFDKAIRHGTVRGVHAPVFLHKSCKPLPEVDLRNAEDAGQQSLFDEHGFAVECEGMCGL